MMTLINVMSAGIDGVSQFTRCLARHPHELAILHLELLEAVSRASHGQTSTRAVR